MRTSFRFSLHSLIGLLILAGVLNPPSAQGCNQVSCRHGERIVIGSGMIVGAVRSGCGNDTIIVEPGGQVVSQGREAIGIDSGNGHDSVINAGAISVLATAVQDAGQQTSHSGSQCGSQWKKTSPDASATAIGIQTGNGNDSVLNTGTISVTASSLLTDSGTARSLAIGIDNGNGKDSSENLDSAIESAASIEVEAISSASLSDNSWELAGENRVDLSVDTEAVAVGIVGGNGKDTISNASTLTVSAVSDISAEGTSATLLGVGSVNMSIHGTAFAVGIDGGNGKDEIFNQGDITVAATSTIETDSIAVSGFGAAEVNDGEFDGSTTAEAAAVGIYTGNSKDEVLGISNTSTIDVQATASVNADSYALTLAGDAITDTSITATAAATGIGAGSGKDTIANAGALTVGASAIVDSFSFDLNLLDIFKSKADLDALAAAVGIDSGSGNDSVLNTGTIAVSAEASTEAWTAEFNAVDVAVGDFSSSSTAEAVGIATGQGKDTITNTGTISADAAADALVGNFTLTMVDLTLIPDLLDTVGGASTTVDAAATGIASGCQDDTITSSGDITATATTEATTIAVGVGAEGIPAGVPKADILSFENLASAGVELDSQATGIDSGTGDDEITNQGKITADASATSWGGSLSLSLPLLEKIVPFPSPAFAMISAGTDVDSDATGIQAGEGDDLIRNEGDLDIDASSSALNVTASMAFQGFVSDIDTIDLAAARVDALTKVEAVAVGIDGGEGNDRIINSGDITVDAASEALSIGAAIAIQKKVSKALNLEGTLADVRAIATAEASGISGGTGDDTITSSGTTTVAAESDNAGVALSAAVTCEAEKGLVVNAAVAKADTTATAEATGIDGGAGYDKIYNSGAVDVSADAGTLSAAVALTLQGSNTDVIGLQGALATVTTTAEATATGLSGGSGCDVIVNEGAVTVEADSLAIAASVAVDIMPGDTKGIGIALANAQNKATATATGISGGEGNDFISNSGEVTVDADATAVAASVSVVRKGAAGAGTLDPVSFDSGNNAEAVATGIGGGAGNEIICNSGALDVSSTAVAPSVGVAVSSKGVSAAITTASATATSTGIDTGEGTHWIHNTGAITANALATAVGVSVSVAGEGVAAGIDTVWDGGTTATATAAGIHAESGSDVITNEAAIAASSTAVAPSVDVAVTGKGVSVGISTATAEARSTGIDAGAGDDQIYNSGAITSTSVANADAISVDISGKGVAVSGNDVWDGGVEATAVAKGIDAGAGSNIIVNEGSIAAESTAVAASVGVSIVGKGLSASVSTATATAESVGIDPGDTTEYVWNSGDISAEATATAVTVNVDITGKGVAVAVDEVWDGGTTATATARGIVAGDVDNTIWNEGKIDVAAAATAPSVGVAIAGKGLTAATTTSTATAEAIGIDTQNGNDIVHNFGAITADASATGVAVAASITAKGIAAAFDEVWDGGTDTSAVAKGIDTGIGDDSILSSGDITATSDATTVAVDVAITAKGISAAASTATTTATAIGIDSGAGNDNIQSEGAISADASATGVAVAASITAKGISAATDAVWDGGTDTTTIAKGIDTGIGDDSILSTGDITANSDATTVAVDAAITAMGISAAATTATTTATAVGIDSGAGNDNIQSEGAITADASATGVAVAASIAAKGIAAATDAVWDGGTDTTSIAKGIDAGIGNDGIVSIGAITANSDATTVAVDAAITAMGISAAASTATTTATAIGIDSGAGNDSIHSEGAITADASATGVAVAASITGMGIAGSADAVWDGGTDTTARAAGIDAGDGNDLIESDGAITATADATTVAVDVAIAGKGIAVAATASATTAHAAGIDGGAGNDTIANTGNITADSSALGVGVAAGITGLGISGATDAVWDSGTTATAVAKGIAAGAGDDTVTNKGNILVTSEADTVAVDVAFTVAGLTGAMTNTTVEAQAIGIDGGDGADSIYNEGSITGSADATAVGVAVSLSGAGISASATDLWENGVSGEALFAGIAAGSGNDTIVNSGAITGTSETTTPAISVSVTLAGIGAAANTATADAAAFGIDGGAGDDLITNSGVISVTSAADANTVIVSVAGVGVAAGIDSIWDGGTTATAAATGIAGGEGNDLISNTAAIGTSATADTASTGVTATLAGASASLVNSTASAVSAGIAGGEGNDTISNTGAIVTSANADADTVAVSVSGIGASFAGDQWSEDTLASATAIGIDGGGGNDTIRNTAAIAATAVSNSDATAVTVSLVGYADSEAENISETLAAGISGGGGDDTIDNSGNITVVSSSTADAGNVTVNLAGAAPAEAGTTAMAVGIGIDGGVGDDTIRNSGNLSITSGATTDASSVSVALVGYGDSEADNLSAALATGISGGEGNDTISNSGNITLVSTSTAEAGSVSIGLAGAVFGEAGTTASAATVGLDGGAGADVIQNSGAIAATATASTDSSSTGVVLLGYGDSSAECASSAAAIGISGGDGDDTIVNSATGSISLVSLATAKAGGVQVGLAGAVGGEAGTTATAIATAIDGGLGADTIRNAAQLSVLAMTSTSADSTTVGIFGSADADVNTNAVTIAQGIAGGDGADLIENTGDISVASRAAMSLDAYAFDFGGSSAGQGTLAALSSAIGIAGGSGSDTIDNEGQITVSAAAAMTVAGGSDVAFGSASAGANTTAVTNAVGIDAGAGDDTISNRNTLVVSALTTMALDSSSFSFGGSAASGEGAMSASTGATGISGGDGADAIVSEAAITVSPRTALSALSGSDVAFGSAGAGSTLTADTQAAGIDAGSGNDTVINRGGITVGYYTEDATDAMTKIDVSGSTWSLGGTGSVSAVALATGSAIGIDGGSGDDVLLNEANVEVNSTTYAKTHGSSYSFAGTSGSSGVVTAAASAVGIRGGEGNDTIRNSAVLTVRARSYTDSTGSAETTFGSSEAFAGATSSASAVGIDGGAGDEVIENAGTVSVAALAYAHGSTDSDVFAGSPSATSETTVTAFAAGIAAEAGNNSVDNDGLIAVSATASAVPDATADSDISDNEASASAGTIAHAVGISALEGNDAIGNGESGSIIAAATVTAAPYAHSDEDSTAIGFGYAATARGIEAGGGDNLITNLGTIQATANASILATAVSRSLTYTAYSNAYAAAAAEAAGISTGQGNDVISNGENGTIRASAAAVATALGTPRPGEGAHTDYGNATVGFTWFPLTARASGIAAGDGDNTIENHGAIDAEATAQVTAKGVADTTTYRNTATANAVVTTVASGISAGNGTDTILNDLGASIGARATTVVSAAADPDERGYINAPGVSAQAAAYGITLGNGSKGVINAGSISAIAESTAVTSASAESDLWDTVTDIVATVSATAQGIATGSGDSDIVNSGDIEARATSVSSAYSYSDSIDDALAQVNAVVRAEAAGVVTAGGGSVGVENSGSIDVSAKSQNDWYARADSGGVGFGEVNYYVQSPSVSAAEAYGIAVGDAAATTIRNEAQAEIKVDAKAYLYAAANGDEKSIIGRSGSDRGAEVTAAAAGVSVGDGDNQVYNEGSISVGLEAKADARTKAYSGNRSTHTYACVETAGDAYGIATGDGVNLIDNAGDITVTADGKAWANLTDSSWGDIQSDSGADALAYANALVSVSGTGLQAGSGANAISNSGLIAVSTTASAFSNTYADDNGAAYDDYADSYSYAYSQAYGIRAGLNGSSQGSNVIHNIGDIVVASQAGSSAYAYARDFGWFDDGGHSYREANAAASSYGILTGDADSWITNDGTIHVSATASGDAGRTSAQAYGIKTGSGDDLIVNNGTITTLVTVNGVSVKGIGIDTGTGNDQVVFGDGSYIGCDLDLGEGNDGLTVIGSGTISGSVYGGLGTDALTLDGATNFNLDQTFDFESLAKLGSSTVSLNNAQMLESLDVFEGILQINNNYQFTGTGSFSTKVYGGGNCGQLIVLGDLGLDGTMTVVRGPGAYLDGASYDVLVADSLSGAFDNIVLPGSTPLLSFDVTDTGNNSYLVAASTKRFASVATNKIEQAVTANLDAIVASVEGDLSLVLGEIQAMPASGYGTAFSSLSPDSYDCTTRTTFSAADQISQVLGSRLRSLRLPAAGRSADSGLRPPIDRTAFGARSGSAGTPDQLAAPGLWLGGFGQWGGFAAGDGYTGFDFSVYGTTLGYDRLLGSGFTAGASLGYSTTEVYFDGARGAGLVNGVTGSLYGSYCAEGLYLDTAVSYGRQSYENTRYVEVGSLQRTAESDHGGNSLLAYLGGGYTLGIGPWTAGPVVAAQYMRLSEEAFAEQGAGSVSLDVQERTTDSLVSDLGLRLGLSLNPRRVNLVSELYAAWRHDFGIDEGSITASFLDSPNAPFTISGPEAQADGVLLGASLVLRESGRFSAAIKYNLELRGEYRANSLMGEIQYGF